MQSLEFLLFPLLPMLCKIGSLPLFDSLPHSHRMRSDAESLHTVH
jgi:hypothetical protein